MPSMSKLRLCISTYALCFSLANVAQAAFAEVLISVNKNTQQMSVSVDGVPRYRFAVSTGRAGYGTPNGTYHPQRLAASWFSKLYYNSPMPHSIFFHGGYAIHGSYEINRLGGPASHGCIRLHPANAATLYTLVKSEGMGATTIVVSGSNPAVASSPAPTPRRYGWERPSSEDRFRPDDGQPSGYYWRPQAPSDYYWRREPRSFPFFNSY
jgi:L,D-transpeptidase catalytic domain